MMYLRSLVLVHFPSVASSRDPRTVHFHGGNVSKAVFPPYHAKALSRQVPPDQGKSPNEDGEQGKPFTRQITQQSQLNP